MRSELFEEAWKQNRHVWESTKCLAQAMYLAGQESQQSKVDELQLKLSEDSRILHNVIDIERKKNDELQKRVDASLIAFEKLKDEINQLHGQCDLHLIKYLEEKAQVLEQALKGEG